MKIRTQMVMAGALLALAVPAAANAATAKVVASHGKTSTAAHKSGHSLKTVKSSPAPVTHPVTYTVVPETAPAAPESQADLCQTTGTGCTDEQYCDFWQIGCPDATAASIAESEAASLGLTDTDPATILTALENEYCADPYELMSLV